MNNAIADATKEAEIDFVDITEAFDRRELRCSGPSFLNRLSLHPELFPASYHPNGDGYAKIAEVVAAALSPPD